MHVVMVGTGYVGLVSGVCLAAVGHSVTCVDVSQSKVDLLNQGKSPIFEDGLEELIVKHKDKNLFFKTDLVAACRTANAASRPGDTVIIMIAVGTPDGVRGADLTQVFSVAEQLATAIPETCNAIVVTKSTVPVGTGDKVWELVNRARPYQLEVVSNPEFLKEGLAVNDFMRPDRIIIGTDCVDKVKAAFQELYAPFIQDDPNKLLFMARRSSELAKYAANCMLATRISFMNEMAQLCDATGANVDDVRRGIGADPRIGNKFLNAGIGWGGSCFLKDIKALCATGQSSSLNMQIIHATNLVNDAQARYTAMKLFHLSGFSLPGKLITVWGLTYKPATDDVRDSPVAVAMNELIKFGADSFVLTDPQGMENFERTYTFPKHVNISYVPDMYEAVVMADILALMTEWPEYRCPDWARVMKMMCAGGEPTRCAVADMRNQYDPETVRGFGFLYTGMGRQ